MFVLPLEITGSQFIKYTRISFEDFNGALLKIIHPNY